jgi:hypothetical protein
MAAGFYLSHGIPNNHLRWVCSRSWGFHIFIFFSNVSRRGRCNIGTTKKAYPAVSPLIRLAKISHKHHWPTGCGKYDDDVYG